MSQIKIEYGTFSFLSEKGYPTPNITLGTDQLRTSAGDYLVSEKTITLEGVCYAAKKTSQEASITPSAQTDTTIEGLFLLASGLQTGILQNNNQPLKIYILGSTQQNDNYLINNNAQVDSISFKENANNWRNTIDYTISLKVYVSGSGSYLTNAASNNGHYVTSVTDTYSLQLMDDNQYLYQDQYVPTYKLSRTIGAVGRRINIGSGALYHAKEWVINREKTSPLTGMFRPSDFILYNQERQVDIDEPGGSYTITDSFIAKSGDPWIDSYNISVEVDNMFNRKISINGSIQGLEPASGIYDATVIDITKTNNTPPNSVSGYHDLYPTTTGINGYANNNGLININGSNIAKTKYGNAVSGYINVKNNLFNRTLSYDLSSQSLISNDWDGQAFFTNYKTRPINPLPLSVTESMYPFDGKITYQAEYDSRPISIMTGAISETFTLNDKAPSIRVQEIQILGRRLGPLVYEYYNSSGIGNRTVSYEAIFPRPTGLKQYSFPQALINGIDNMLLTYKPEAPLTGQLREDTQQIILTENKIVCTKSWDYTKCAN